MDSSAHTVHHGEKLPPSPPSPLEVALVQNQLTQQGRAVLDLAWRGQESDATDVPERVLDVEAYDDFWENGALFPMQTFEQVLEDVEKHPEGYTKQIVVNARWYATPLTDQFKHGIGTEHILSEAQGLQHLDSFFDVACERSQGTDVHETIVERVTTLRENLGYLSETDLNFAVNALTELWAEYLTEHPEANINIYMREGRYSKSFEYVHDILMDRLAEVHPELLERIRQQPEEWTDGDDDKLVILDDWVISGESAIRMSSKAIEVAQQHGLKLQETEVHSIAREATAAPAPGITYRSVYLHSTLKDHKEASMFGAHAKVNYGFEHVVRGIQRDLQSEGIYLPVPLMTRMEPVSYRDVHAQDVIESDASITFLNQISSENARALELLGNIAQLEKELAIELEDSSSEADDVVIAAEADAGNAEGYSPAVREGLAKVVELRLELRKMTAARKQLRQSLGWSGEKI